MNTTAIRTYARIILKDLSAGQSAPEFVAERQMLPVGAVDKVMKLMAEKEYLIEVQVRDFTAYRLSPKGWRELN